MDKELSELISILDSECDVLKKKGLMLSTVDQPWRYYSTPLYDGYQFEHLRSVINAGKYTVEAENKIKNGVDAWQLLAMAQQALLRSLSTYWKAERKKSGNSKGGESKDESIRELVFEIADDILYFDPPERGLPVKITNILFNDYPDITEDKVRRILKKL